MTDHPTLDDFPTRSYDKLRYGDTDRQGHVNNAVFASLAETGRVEVLQIAQTGALSDDEGEFVLARLEIDFVGEIRWPGTVEIGTGVDRVGTSSVTLAQGFFQDGVRVGASRSVVVQIDAATRASRPLSDAARERLAQLQLG